MWNWALLMTMSSSFPKASTGSRAQAGICLGPSCRPLSIKALQVRLFMAVAPRDRSRDVRGVRLLDRQEGKAD